MHGPACALQAVWDEGLTLGLCVSSKNLLKDKEGRFPSDTALLQDPELLKWVEAYAQDQALFFKDFTASYLKMGLLGVNGGA